MKYDEVKSKYVSNIKQKYMLTSLAFGFFVMDVTDSNARYAERRLCKKQQACIDSLKQVEYGNRSPVPDE
jgi:hypothetical protein